MVTKKTQVSVRKDRFTEWNFLEKSLAVFWYAFVGYLVVFLGLGIVVGILSALVW